MKSTNKQRALEIIEEFGPISSADVAEQLGVSDAYGRALVSYWKTNKHIHISLYVRVEEGRRLYPRALYSAGYSEDAAKPVALSRREYRQRHRALKRSRSTDVFTMAVPVDLRRVTSRKRPDVTEKLRKERAQRLANVTVAAVSCEVPSSTTV